MWTKKRLFGIVYIHKVSIGQNTKLAKCCIEQENENERSDIWKDKMF